jgi:hypothetical protein
MSSGAEKNVVTDQEKEKEEAEKAKWMRGINLCFQLIEEHSAKLQPGQSMRLLDVLNDELLRQNQMKHEKKEEDEKPSC